MATNIAAEKTKEAEMDAKLRKLRERITALEGYKQVILFWHPSLTFLTMEHHRTLKMH